ncbi:SMP-30/gluconolactonase/LRE family protein [Phycisphaera mikurensis]|uniref:Putative diisopropyl-fluorophosphatase n=1 Tax=Phycisphaera mikurensis (strain NBRC 102666 / KCTC 22515 / FYK2301M01) TaxID=1142394 RepID=I0ICV4_PHYMF|nr:SMP-30/gluconolactonase/LRE family protein [Phycisphaera mikurensis]MBB6442223.1 gluconolactonase [Phycisphaera mikurensis]BAM03092.1 putative diisopropyl-fluorophosphatase [Phycisphaera mikurensis NBRC 102666]
MLTTPPRRLAAPVPGAEGPIQDHDGRWFVVSSAGPILELLDGGGTREHARTDGGPAGMQVDADNRLWLIDSKLGVLRIDPDGSVEPVVTEQDGRPLKGCNDGALDDDGNLYFTVPDGSGLDARHGRVCCRLLDGTVRTVAEGFAFCNGLAVGPDNRTLIVAETMTRKLIAFDLPEPGVLANRRDFATLPGGNEIGADGIDFDAEGRLVVANYGEGELDVFDADGGLLDRVELPFGEVTNLHLGGPDGRDLILTEHETPGVWKTRWPVPGIRQSRACRPR